jgi:surface antigen
VNYDTAERRAFEQAAETKSDRWVVGSDEAGYAVFTQPPQVGTAMRHIKASDAEEMMAQQPVEAQQVSGNKKPERIRGFVI